MAKTGKTRTVLSNNIKSGVGMHSDINVRNVKPKQLRHPKLAKNNAKNQTTPIQISKLKKKIFN